MLVRIFSLILVSLFFLSPLNLLAQDNIQNSTRPKIGLVLKGGGALGFAHVGVLKVLEEQRVPIDFIAGTSIGSIVGAAYASGTPLLEMERIMLETNWGELFGEKVLRENIDYRFKGGRAREIYGEGKIGFKQGSAIIPRGLVAGNNIRLLFQQMFGYPANPISFDSLPIPFRAVTADVETGQAYIPDRGDLATVVRASMSIPGAFSPVEIDGRLLVDGGIANNLPVDVALEMGADVLIVIDLISELAKRAELESPLAVSGQVISLLLMQNSAISRSRVRPQDVLIEPDVSGYLVSDFPKGAELMAIGQKTASLKISELQNLSLSEADYQAYSARRTTKLATPAIIDFVRLKNDSIYPSGQINEKLTLKKGQQFDPEQLEDDISRIYQTGQFESVEYSLVSDQEQSGVEIHARGKSWFEQYIRLGLSLEDNLRGDNRFRLGAAGRINSVTNKGSYLEAVAEIGATPKLGLELYQLFSENSNYFLNPKISYGSRTIDISRRGDIIAEYNATEGLGSLAIGRRLWTLGETSLGLTRGFGEVSRRIGDPSLDEFSYDIGDVFWSIDLDNLDKIDFPTSGFRFYSRVSASVEALGASGAEFQDWSGSFSWPYSFGRNTILLSNRSASTFGARPAYRYFTVGGFLSMSGTLQNSFPASDFSNTALVFYRRFSELENPFFDIAAFLGASYEATTLYSKDPRFDDKSLVHSGSVFIGADTPLFPLYFGFGMADTGDHSFHVTLGRVNPGQN
jgi:NTE family protein